VSTRESFHPHDEPGTVQPRGGTPGPADEAFGIRTRPDADHEPGVGFPRTADAFGTADVLQIAVHLLGGEAQGELAQRGEVAFFEEAAHRLLGTLAEIHLAVGHALQQFFDTEVDELDLVREIEDRIRHRLR
jgi:hypothetical protein